MILTVRTRSELVVRDQDALLTAAQEIARRGKNTPMPTDERAALRLVLTEVDPVALEVDAADYGLAVGPYALVACTDREGERGWTDQPFPGVDPATVLVQHVMPAQ